MGARIQKILYITLIVLTSGILLLTGSLIGMQNERTKLIRQEQAEVVTDIAIVNLDEGVYEDGKRTYYSTVLMDLDAENLISDNLESARQGILNGSYAAYILIPSDFSHSAISINSVPQKAVLEFAVNPNLREDISRLTMANVKNFEISLNTNMSYMYVQALLAEFHNVQDLSEKILENDALETERLLGIDAKSLLVMPEYVEVELIETEIEEIDFTDSFDENEKIFDSVYENYEMFIKDGEDAYAEIKEKEETIVTEVESFHEEISKIDISTDSDGNSIYESGLEALESYVADYDVQYLEQKELVTDIIHFVVTGEKNSEEVPGNQETTGNEETPKNIEIISDEGEQEDSETTDIFEGIKPISHIVKENLENSLITVNDMITTGNQANSEKFSEMQLMIEELRTLVDELQEEENTDPPGEGGGENTDLPGEEGGENTDPPGEEGGENTDPPGEGGGENTDPPGEGGGENTDPPEEGGGEDTDPPGEGEGEDTDPPIEEDGDDIALLSEGGDGDDTDTPPEGDGEDGDDTDTPPDEDGEGGEDTDPPGEGGGENTDPPGEGGGENTDPPGEGGGENTDPPGEGGGDNTDPPGEGGGENTDPPGEGGGENTDPPGEGGGENTDPPGEGGGENTDPPPEDDPPEETTIDIAPVLEKLTQLEEKIGQYQELPLINIEDVYSVELDLTSFDKLKEEIEKIEKLDTEKYENIFNERVVLPLEEEIESENQRVQEASEAMMTPLEEYITELAEFDLYSFYDQEKMDGLLLEFSDNIFQLEEQIVETHGDYEEFVYDAMDSTNETMTTLQEALEIAQEDTASNVSKEVALAKEQRESMNAYNTEILGSFQSKLPYTRIGQLEYSQAYDFMVKPIQMSDTSIAKDRTLIWQDYDGLRDVLIIMIVLWSICVCWMLFLRMRRLTRDTNDNV